MSWYYSNLLRTFTSVLTDYNPKNVPFTRVGSLEHTVENFQRNRNLKNAYEPLLQLDT